MECNPATEQYNAALVAARKEFRHFLPMVFYELNPQDKLHWNWHLDLICHTLERILPNTPPNHKIKRLIVNVPPRSLKSITFSVALRAYLLGHFPHERIIGASYAGKLSAKFNQDALKVMKSEWYKTIFPEVTLKKETEAVFTTTAGGHSVATSVGGTILGLGSSIIVADDVLNADQAASDTERNNVNVWFDQSLSTRLDDKANGIVVVVMQRLHEEDLTGHLLQKNANLPKADQWHHICLPAVADQDATYHYYDQTHHYNAGDILQPQRDTPEVLKSLEVSLGSYAYAGQYLQRPAPADGGIIDPNWFKTYQTLPPKEQITRIIQSWDTAIKDTARSDFSVCSTWYETQSSYYLVDLMVEKLEYPALKARVLLLAQQHSPNAILIEDKASGQQLIQDFRVETTLPIVPIMPKGDKIVRVSASSPTIEAGRVLIPHTAQQLPWYNEWFKQFSYFPNATHDDIPDSVAQFILWATRTGHSTPRMRSLAITPKEVEALRPPTQPATTSHQINQQL